MERDSTFHRCCNDNLDTESREEFQTIISPFREKPAAAEVMR